MVFSKWAQASEATECHLMLASLGRREGFLRAIKFFGRIMGLKGLAENVVYIRPIVQKINV